MPVAAAQSSQGVRLRVYITNDSTPSTVGATTLKPPNPKPIRSDVPHLESDFIDKLTHPVTDQGDMTAEFFANTADATHLQLQDDANTRPSPSRKWDLVTVIKDPVTGAESIGEVLSTWWGTITDFPRTFTERQPIKGTLTISLDKLPIRGEPTP